jgi:ketosteroid isomerase-like protein
MSQANLEMARRCFEAWHRGDLDAAFEDVAPDFELDMSRSIGMDRGIYNLSQARRLGDEFWEVWERIHVGAEYVDAGEHVVIKFANRVRGPGGIEVWARGTWLGTIRDGSIVRICLYQDAREALEAAGLSE